jgi:DNA end-binding protein Ku
MAPRANWKGYLRLSLVSCPIALFPATSDAEKTSFHQIHRKTGNRVRMQRVDEVTREPVEYADIIKGYEVSKGQYLDVTGEELDAIALESKRTIDIDEFVPRKEIDQLYNERPYYIVPDGDVGADAFVVIRDAISDMDQVAIGRVVLTNREHVIALEARGKGIMGTLLRYPYEVRDEADYFGDIPDLKTPKDMMDLARHIVEQKAGHFQPEKFEDRYENALKELLKNKQSGEKITPAMQRTSAKVVNLMDALRRSVEAERGSGTRQPGTREPDKLAKKTKTRTSSAKKRKAG